MRGNKTSKAARELRTRKAIEYLKVGNTVTQTAKALGVSRDTIWRNLRKHYTEFANSNQEAISAMLAPLIYKARAGHIPSLIRVMNILDGRPQPMEEDDDDTEDTVVTPE